MFFASGFNVLETDESRTDFIAHEKYCAVVCWGLEVSVSTILCHGSL